MPFAIQPSNVNVKHWNVQFIAMFIAVEWISFSLDSITLEKKIFESNQDFQNELGETKRTSARASEREITMKKYCIRLYSSNRRHLNWCGGRQQREMCECLHISLQCPQNGHTNNFQIFFFHMDAFVYFSFWFSHMMTIAVGII